MAKTTLPPRLSPAVLRQVQQKLWQRVKASGDRKIHAIGFGIKVRRMKSNPAKSRRHPALGLAVRFYTSDKRDPKKAARAIPASVEVTVREGKRRRTVRLVTDVVDLRRRFRATGTTVRNGQIRATAGVIVQWTDRGEKVWGLLTVAHFVRDADLGDPIRVFPSNGGTGFEGMLAWRSRLAEGLDIAVIQTSEGNLVAADMLPDPGDLVPLRTKRQLETDLFRRAAGSARRTALTEETAFELMDFHPTIELSLDGSRGNTFTAVDCYSVDGRLYDRPYPLGTSGNSWWIGNRLAMMQLGADIPNCSIGIGQPLVVTAAALTRAFGRGFRWVHAF